MHRATASRLMKILDLRHLNPIISTAATASTAPHASVLRYMPSYACASLPKPIPRSNCKVTSSLHCPRCTFPMQYNSHNFAREGIAPWRSIQSHDVNSDEHKDFPNLPLQTHSSSVSTSDRSAALLVADASVSKASLMTNKK